MKEKHRRVILEAMPLIIHDLIVDPSFLTQFEAKNIFIDNTIETIMSKKTSQQKANFFCQYIIRANDDAFRVLRNVLYETSQVHIAEELKKIKNNIGKYTSKTGKNAGNLPESRHAPENCSDIIKQNWEQINKHLTVEPQFLSHFVKAGLVGVDDFYAILKGSLNKRVYSFFGEVNTGEPSFIRVLLEALKETKQDHVAKDIQRSLKDYANDQSQDVANVRHAQDRCLNITKQTWEQIDQHSTVENQFLPHIVNTELTEVHGHLKGTRGEHVEKFFGKLNTLDPAPIPVLINAYVNTKQDHVKKEIQRSSENEHYWSNNKPQPEPEKTGNSFIRITWAAAIAVTVVIIAVLAEEWVIMKPCWMMDKTDIYGTDSNGRTALVTASIGGCLQAARVLIARGAAIETKDKNGWKALHHAVHHGHTPLVTLLLKRGTQADDDKTLTKLNVVHESTTNNSKTLESWLRLYYAYNHTFAEIHDAIHTNDACKMESFLDSLGTIYWMSRKSNLAVSIMVFIWHRGIINSLNKIDLADKRTWDEVDTGSHNGLFKIFHKDDITQMRQIPDYYTQVNADTIKGRTPLMLAVSSNYTEIAEVLIMDGSSVHARDEKGWSALHHAAHHGYTSSVRLLLQHDAFVDARDDEKWTALHIASLKGHTNVVQLLLDTDAGIDSMSRQGWTPMMCAAFKGHWGIVRDLIRHKAGIDFAENRGNTALHLAAIEGHDSIVYILLNNGANTSVRNSLDKTALDCARDQRHTNVVKVFQDIVI